MEACIAGRAVWPRQRARRAASTCGRERGSCPLPISRSGNEGFTPAYLKEALVAAALERAQAGATVLDEEFARQVLEQVEELRAHLKKMKNPDALGEMRSVDDVIGFRR